MSDDLQTMKLRYGPEVDDFGVMRLITRESRNSARIDLIDSQIESLMDERIRLRNENERIAIHRLVAEEASLERIREEHGEGWSPIPVRGYRIWTVNDSQPGLVGATGHRWTSPEQTATCDAARDDDDLPHSDHRCSDYGYGCGIYAAKSADDVDPGPSIRWVLGLVSLTGKVIEHDHGYRAARARVVAIVGHGVDHAVATSDSDHIHAVFAEGLAALHRLGTFAPPTYGTELEDRLNELERSITPWT